MHRGLSVTAGAIISVAAAAVQVVTFGGIITPGTATRGKSDGVLRPPAAIIHLALSSVFARGCFAVVARRGQTLFAFGFVLAFIRPFLSRAVKRRCSFVFSARFAILLRGGRGVEKDVDGGCVDGHVFGLWDARLLRP